MTISLNYLTHLGEEERKADPKLPPRVSAPPYLCKEKSEGDEKSAGENSSPLSLPKNDTCVSNNIC